MFYRKVYIKLRVFLYSIRHITNAILVVLMSSTLLYLFVNNFFFSRVINNLANNDELSGKYSNALNLYRFEYLYYSFNHFSNDNKDIFFELPYKKATCYLKTNEKQKSVESMLDGITAIQKQYGIFSKETAYFMRKYLIEYYLDNNKLQLANQEFRNLLTIYKKVGYSDAEMADMIRLSGDLYYEQKKYDEAMEFYRKAYSAISTSAIIDYPVYVKIVTRIADYELHNKNEEIAIQLYQSTIKQLETAGIKQNNLRAGLLIILGDLYDTKPNKIKDSISCYEEVIAIAKKLPNTSYLKQNIDNYYGTLRDFYNRDGQFHKVAEIDVELAKKRRFAFLYIF